MLLFFVWGIWDYAWFFKFATIKNVNGDENNYLFENKLQYDLRIHGYQRFNFNRNSNGNYFKKTSKAMYNIIINNTV